MKNQQLLIIAKRSNNFRPAEWIFEENSLPLLIEMTSGAMHIYLLSRANHAGHSGYLCLPQLGFEQNLNRGSQSHCPSWRD